MSTDLKLVFCSAPNDVAEGLARELVERKLVACVNVLPGATAIYRWQGALQRETETLMWMESAGEAMPALLEALTHLHPYEVPKILALDASDAHPGYLDWVRSQVEG